MKVTFELARDAWHGHTTESVWAKPVGSGKYEIRNVPFYAPGVSYGDIVNARHSSGRLAVTGVSSRRGHSTYRIILKDGITEEKFKTAWLPLEKLGCTYERATSHLFGIDVPSETNVVEAYELLKAGQARGVWDFEEGHYGHSG